MTLAAGTRLGPYEILTPLGAGGMGEVYRARDARLGRDVAVKVLPSHLSSSAEVRQRFEREAKTVSQLSHPHICALYDVGREGDVDYLVMELLEGETLSERLVKGSLPLEQTLRYGQEIAGALDKAHRQGIVHRDLKPGNVMLTKSGVKLLDFGLAKVMAPEAAKGSLTSLPTQQGLTEEGTILGTFQYMAPEQLEGKEADARTDVFAFGAVLYEMATGKKAFSGASQASLIAAILEREPAPISSVQPTSPPALDRVVRRCLAKDPEDRWQSAADLGSELRWISESSASGSAAPTAEAGRRRGRERLAWTTAAGFAVAAAAALVWLLAQRGSGSLPRGSVRAVVPLPAKAEFEGAVVPEISPDGRTIALSGLGSKSLLWLRTLGADDARPVPGTESARYAFWSPDGRSVGFFAEGKLKRVDLASGAVSTICDAAEDQARGGSWGADGTIVFSGGRDTGLSRVPAAGGNAQALTKPDASRGDTSHRWPYFLPDGRHLIYFATPNTSSRNAIFFASSDGQENRLLLEDASNVAFSAGRLLFVRKNKLFAQDFDPRRGRLAGAPVLVAENVGSGFGVTRAMFSASADGTLVYAPSPPPQRSTLEWIGRDGRRTAVAEAMEYYTPRLSPDGTRVAVGIFDRRSGQGDIWILDLLRGGRTRLTFGPDSAWTPVWSPDSTRVAYVRSDDHTRGIFVKDASGGGAEEKLLALESMGDVGDEHLQDWSPDGSQLAFGVWRPGAGTNYDVFLLPLHGDRKPVPVLATKDDEHDLRFAPDGLWIAYSADTGSGNPQIYVQSFPEGKGKRQVTSEGGGDALWPRKAGELFFTAEGRLSFSAVGPGPSFSAAQPFFAAKQPSVCSDVAPDGQRVLNCFPVAEDAASAVELILDWPAGLRK